VILRKSMRRLLLVLLLLSSPALALDQSQIQAACYTDCDKENQSNSDYKACLARAADTADALLNQEFSTLQEAVAAAAKDMDVKPNTQLDMLKEAQRPTMPAISRAALPSAPPPRAACSPPASAL
jgi:uncharacterized protein YecT (DUF1311 family)